MLTKEYVKHRDGGWMLANAQRTKPRDLETKPEPGRAYFKKTKQSPVPDRGR